MAPGPVGLRTPDGHDETVAQPVRRTEQHGGRAHGEYGIGERQCRVTGGETVPLATPVTRPYSAAFALISA